jgi:hypothetical protein
MQNASEETIHLLQGRFTGNEARLKTVASHKESWRFTGLLPVNPSSALFKRPSEERPSKIAQERIDLGKEMVAAVGPTKIPMIRSSHRDSRRNPS